MEIEIPSGCKDPAMTAAYSRVAAQAARIAELEEKLTRCTEAFNRVEADLLAAGAIGGKAEDRVAELEGCLADAAPVVRWCWSLQTPGTPRALELGEILGRIKRLLAEAGGGG